jgi:hypothetical protein
MTGRLIAAVCLAALPAAARAAAACPVSEAGAKTALTQRYADLKTTMGARDRAGMLAILAPGFISEDASGEKKGAEAVIAMLAQLPHDPNKVSTTTIDALSLKGATAQVRQHYHLNTTKAGPDGKPRAIEIDAHSTDVWTCSGGVWRQNSTRTDEIELKVDGQVLGHQVHAKP